MMPGGGGPDAGDGPEAAGGGAEGLGLVGETGLRIRRRRGPATTFAIVLIFLAAIGLVVLTAAGFYQAFYLLLVAAVGVLLIAIGARLH
jgi:hypothetical protein